MNSLTRIVCGIIAITSVPALALASVSVSTDISGSVRMEDGVEVSAESNTRAETSTKIEGESDVEIAFGSGPTVIVRSELLDDASVSIKASTEVQSKTDLDAYAKGLVMANANIRDVTLSESEVAVSHREHAYVFGIFATEVFARAKVASDGSVKIKFPWYVFAGEKQAEMESKLMSIVNTHVATADANATARFSVQSQAQILEKTAALLKGEFEANAKAEVN